MSRASSPLLQSIGEYHSISLVYLLIITEIADTINCEDLERQHRRSRRSYLPARKMRIHSTYMLCTNSTITSDQHDYEKANMVYFLLT